MYDERTHDKHGKLLIVTSQVMSTLPLKDGSMLFGEVTFIGLAGDRLGNGPLICMDCRTDKLVGVKDNAGIVYATCGPCYLIRIDPDDEIRKEVSRDEIMEDENSLEYEK